MLFIARRDGSEVFEFAEEAFHQITIPVTCPQKIGPFWAGIFHL